MKQPKASKTKRRAKKGSHFQLKTKTYEDYLAANEKNKKISLFPIMSGVDSNGQIIRKRMPAQMVEMLFEKGYKDLPKYIEAMPSEYPNPQKVFGDYIKFFKNDAVKGAETEELPHDLCFSRKHWVLMAPMEKALRFQKDKAYKVINDPEDHTRNFVTITDNMANRRAILVDYRHRSSPPQELRLRQFFEARRKGNDGKTYVHRICFGQTIGNSNTGHPF